MWDQYIDEFITSLRAIGRAPGTCRLRRHYITAFADAFPDPLAVTRRDIDRWLSRLTVKPDARKGAQVTIRQFYRWLAATGRIDGTPTDGMQPVRIPRALPRPAPDEVYYRAIEAAAPREQLMLKLAREAGLRAGEIASVHRDDLIGEDLHVTGKGGNQRIVPLVDPVLIDAITTAVGYLFPGQVEGHLAPLTVTKLLGDVLEGHWTAHTLRHAFGTAAYRSNPDLFALAEVMGHAKLDTTRRYAAVAANQLRAVVASAAPVVDLRPPSRRRRSWPLAA